jgi:hypothetical protein
LLIGPSPGIFGQDFFPKFGTLGLEIGFVKKKYTSWGQKVQSQLNLAKITSFGPKYFSLGRDSPKSTFTVFSSSRVFHWKSASQRLR